MPVPGVRKTVQSRMLIYVQEIGWKVVTRAESETRRGFASGDASSENRARNATPYFA